jgi:hypothetical protein
MGHLHKRRQNIRSTKPQPTPVPNNTLEDLEPELQGQFFLNKDHTQKSWGPPSRNGRAEWYDIN